MSNFFPTPKFPAEWWRDCEIHDPVAGPEEAYSLPANDQTWLVFVAIPKSLRVFGCHWGPLHFPTPTDALLWLRYSPLRLGLSDPEIAEKCSEAINLIDHAPPHSNAIGILRDRRDLLVNNYPGVDVEGYASIHTWLGDESREAELREELGANEIVCLDGHWSMPDSVWERLSELYLVI